MAMVAGGSKRVWMLERQCVVQPPIPPHLPLSSHGRAHDPMLSLALTFAHVPTAQSSRHHFVAVPGVGVFSLRHVYGSVLDCVLLGRLQRRLSHIRGVVGRFFLAGSGVASAYMRARRGGRVHQRPQGRLHALRQARFFGRSHRRIANGHRLVRGRWRRCKPICVAAPLVCRLSHVGAGQVRLGRHTRSLCPVTL